MAIGSASDSAQGERDYLPSAPMGMASVSVFDADEEGWAAVRTTVEQRLPGRDVVEIRGQAYLDADAPVLQVTRPGCRTPLAECS